MEIDFLGLSSPKYASASLTEERDSTPHVLFDSGDDICLSLCTASLADSGNKFPQFGEKNPWNSRSTSNFGVFLHHSVDAFLYDGTIIQSNTFDPPSTPHSCFQGDYTTTVGMARRATLARFLKKRMHRLTRKRATDSMGSSLNYCEGNKHRCVMKCYDKERDHIISHDLNMYH